MRDRFHFVEIVRQICWIEFAFDDELLDLATASGCAGLLIGFESLNEESLRQMGKSARCRAERFAGAIEEIHARGIRICASFLFGYDNDTAEAFPATLVFAGLASALGLVGYARRRGKEKPAVTPAS